MDGIFGTTPKVVGVTGGIDTDCGQTPVAKDVDKDVVPKNATQERARDAMKEDSGLKGQKLKDAYRVKKENPKLAFSHVEREGFKAMCTSMETVKERQNDMEERLFKIKQVEDTRRMEILADVQVQIAKIMHRAPSP
ncbi:hypothetical protein L7F22_034373 [Adiantum nelumboides]|nr:hypothetical protein [Adiantum nelumboides]